MMHNSVRSLNTCLFLSARGGDTLSHIRRQTLSRASYPSPMSLCQSQSRVVGHIYALLTRSLLSWSKGSAIKVQLGLDTACWHAQTRTRGTYATTTFLGTESIQRMASDGPSQIHKVNACRRCHMEVDLLTPDTSNYRLIRSLMWFAVVWSRGLPRTLTLKEVCVLELGNRMLVTFHRGKRDVGRGCYSATFGVAWASFREKRLLVVLRDVDRPFGTKWGYWAWFSSFVSQWCSIHCHQYINESEWTMSPFT